MAKIFNQISAKRPKRSQFDLSHERKMSMQMGDLVPFLCEEVVPGDTFKMSSEIMLRMAPMIAPVMHRVNVFTHFFFVPNRIIWNQWEDFITGGADGQETPLFPKFGIGNSFNDVFKKGSLMDYLGMTPMTAATPTTQQHVNKLPFRAYQEIYNEFYRDQNMEDPVSFTKDGGTLYEASVLTLRKRAWEKDYFTSALPWTQRGGDVNLPLGGSAPVNLKDGISSAYPMHIRDGDGNLITDEDLVTGTTTGAMQGKDSLDVRTNAFLDPEGNLEADLSSATASTINELRKATRLQTWLERNARGGSRYIEQILSHFGVKSSDSRLQRPEYLGGGKNPVVISEVLQTSSSDTESPQGNMAGHGVGIGNSNNFKKFFEEHGYVIGIVSVLPRTTYQQGNRRIFRKFDKFDYYFPEFANLGEQPVYNFELYNDYTTGNDGTGDLLEDDVFGYQSRYAEYRFVPSTVHGDFRDNLDFWHFGRKFTGAPALNEAFVKSDPTHRPFAVTDPTVNKLYVQIYNNLKAVRPMPYFANPTL